MGSAKRIFGGLLTGAGEGILEDARQRRKETLLRLTQENQTQRDERRETRADERASATHERSRGLLTSVIPDRSGNMVGITRGGDTKKLGFQSGKKSDLPTTGISTEDKRELDAAIARHTSGKGSYEGEVTDWDAAAKRLTKLGREDLAQRIAPLKAASEAGVTVDSPEYREALRLAEEWAEDKAGYFSRDKTDFADTGGSKVQAIQAKTMELYKQLTGSGGATKKPTPATSTAPGAPPGSGTEADPYKATTQAQVDWFKNSAPAGTIIEIDGVLYKK